MTSGFVLWLTGLSGAGKSTLAVLVTAELERRGIRTELFDGDAMRKRLSPELGFSREDRDENVRRIASVALAAERDGVCAVVAAISPYRAARDEARAQASRFVEVYVECPLDVLTARDPKGLYKRALAGEIRQFTGVDDPYESPITPDVHVRTDHEAPAESATRIIAHLEARNLVRGA